MSCQAGSRKLHLVRPGSDVIVLAAIDDPARGDENGSEDIPPLRVENLRVMGHGVRETKLFLSHYDIIILTL